MRASGSEPYDHECEYDDSYCGYVCRECKSFIAYGCAPWEEEEEDVDAFFDTFEWEDDEC